MQVLTDYRTEAHQDARTNRALADTQVPERSTVVELISELPGVRNRQSALRTLLHTLLYGRTFDFTEVLSERRETTVVAFQLLLDLPPSVAKKIVGSEPIYIRTNGQQLLHTFLTDHAQLRTLATLGQQAVSVRSKTNLKGNMGDMLLEKRQKKYHVITSLEGLEEAIFGAEFSGERLNLFFDSKIIPQMNDEEMARLENLLQQFPQHFNPAHMEKIFMSIAEVREWIPLNEAADAA